MGIESPEHCDLVDSVSTELDELLVLNAGEIGFESLAQKVNEKYILFINIFIATLNTSFIRNYPILEKNI